MDTNNRLGLLYLFKKLRNRFTAAISAIVLLVVISTAIFAPYLAPFDPARQNIIDRLLPPLSQGIAGKYWLGTDGLGRDILSRIIYGRRISLIVGICSVIVGGGVGILLGMMAGFYRGFFDVFVMRIVDLQLAIPFLVLAMAVVMVLGANTRNIILVLGLTSWVTYARVVRGEVLAIRERDFIKASHALGSNNRRMLFRHVLPNIFPSCIVLTTISMAQMITMESALSYLGLGIQPPQISWGYMVSEGKDLIGIAWWNSAFPGLAIFITVIAVNILGDWLREVLDSHLL